MCVYAEVLETTSRPAASNIIVRTSFEDSPHLDC